MSSPALSKEGRVFDLLPEMIFILDGKSALVDYNKSAVQAMGFESAGRHPVSMREIVVPPLWADFEGTMKNGAVGSGHETRFVKADGLEIDISYDVRLLQAPGTTYVVVIAKDVTEQKRKELEYLQFSNVIHYTINPIQITDAKGKMVYVNPAFERVSGFSRDELIGKNPNILNSGRHSRDFWGKVWNHILSGKAWVGEVENRRKDGTPFHTELLISPIEDAAGTVVGFLGAHRDLTEQKILERQLLRSQKMESIGTLAAGIAHEVGNPLTSISSLVQVILRTTTDEFTKEKLELVKNQITRIARIIRDLVDFSRPSTYVVRPTDINQTLREAWNIVQYGKKVRDIKVELSLAEDLPLLDVVPDQLSQVFINILINAVDSLEGKAGSIWIRSSAHGNQVTVQIRDSGKGITPEHCEKVFEPFFTTKEVGKGSGLGLWVSYGIVKSFDGDVLLQSAVGKGSTFTIVLPVKGPA